MVCKSVLVIAAWVWISALSADGKLVDLTHFQNDNATMKHPAIDDNFHLDISQRGWNIREGERFWIEYNDLSTPEHLGTHMDAPSHLSNSNTQWRLHQIPVERFIGDAVIIDITERAQSDPDALLLVSDLERWEVEHGQIKDGSIVLMKSGWDKFWGDKAAYFGNDQDDTENFHYPGWSPEACRWLVQKRVINGIGTDAISFDAGNNHKFEAHRIILSENLFGLENVMDLDKVPEAGARLYVFPMKHIDGSGSPCRIIAEFDHLEHIVSSASGCFQHSLKPFWALCISCVVVFFMCK